MNTQEGALAGAAAMRYTRCFLCLSIHQQMQPACRVQYVHECGNAFHQLVNEVTQCSSCSSQADCQESKTWILTFSNTASSGNTISSYSGASALPESFLSHHSKCSSPSSVCRHEVLHQHLPVNYSIAFKYIDLP